MEYCKDGSKHVKLDVLLGVMLMVKEDETVLRYAVIFLYVGLNMSKV